MISGVSENSFVQATVEIFTSLEVEMNAFLWIARVASTSNIADEPSRGMVTDLEACGAKTTNEIASPALDQLISKAFVLESGRNGSGQSFDIPMSKKSVSWVRFSANKWMSCRQIIICMKMNHDWFKLPLLWHKWWEGGTPHALWVLEYPPPSPSTTCVSTCFVALPVCSTPIALPVCSNPVDSLALSLEMAQARASISPCRKRASAECGFQQINFIYFIFGCQHWQPRCCTEHGLLCLKRHHIFMCISSIIWSAQGGVSYTVCCSPWHLGEACLNSGYLQPVWQWQRGLNVFGNVWLWSGIPKDIFWLAVS